MRRDLVLAVILAALALAPGYADPSKGPAGANAGLAGRRVFPADSPWNQEVGKLPVDPNSQALIASIGADTELHPDFGAAWQGKPFGIPYVLVSGKQPRVPVKFEYADESDPGPYPIPPDAPIEGGAEADGDRHVLVIDRDAWVLYEMWSAHPDGKGWKAGSGAIFDLKTNKQRPAGWTSADAAGLPVFAGLARYDEVVEQKAIPHALRFTCRRTRRAYVAPARHWASRDDDPNLPPMGMRVRLRADFDLAGFPPSAKVVLAALQKYGMILADNGSDWYVSGAPDARWKDDDLGALKRVKGSDFEVVKMAEIVTR